MSSSLSKRDLFNRLHGGLPTTRPPFSRPDAVFVEACTGCGDCLAACPEDILARGRGGYPYIDFSQGACTFCGACADICKADAFTMSRRTEDAWDLHAEISQSCLEYKGVSCRACESWCEPRAIRFRPALGGHTEILLDLENCTGCGACVQSCPKGAISITEPCQPDSHNLEAIA